MRDHYENLKYSMNYGPNNTDLPDLDEYINISRQEYIKQSEKLHILKKW